MAWSEDGPEAAQRVVDRLWQTLRQRASEFDLPLLAPSEAIATAMKTPSLVAVTDAALVQRARAAGIGAVLPVQLGAQRSSDYGPPVLLHAQVVLLTDGRFINTGPMERGSVVHCGQSVVLRADRLRVIVTEHVAPCNDPAFFALHGVDLSQTRLLCVKAKKHFRAAFASLCAAIVDAHAPGPASLDLALLPLRRRVN
jgi:microcystin degradation protein MlrC